MQAQQYTTTQVDSLTGPELIELFNKLGPARGLPPVKRFADLNAAKRRVKSLLVAEVIEEKKVVTAVATTPKVPKVKRKRGNRYVFPYKTEVKKVKGKTDRGTLLAMISSKRGATDAELLAATWNDPAHIKAEKRPLTPDSRKKACYEAVRLIHYYCGYGLDEDEHKRVHLRKNPPAPVATFLKEQGYTIEKDQYPHK